MTDNVAIAIVTMISSLGTALIAAVTQVQVRKVKTTTEETASGVKSAAVKVEEVHKLVNGGSTAKDQRIEQQVTTIATLQEKLSSQDHTRRSGDSA